MISLPIGLNTAFFIACGPGTLAFNAAMNATSSQTQSISPGSSTLQTFGKKYDVNSVAKESLMRDANVSDSSILGYPRAPAFGVPKSAAPLLKSSGFVKSAFGINQKGSRTASYIATPDIDCTIPDGAKIQSICGMQTYKDKSQEELRFEDYQLGQKCGSSCGISGTQGFGIINNTRPFISPVFNQATVDQLFYSLFPSTFVVERAEVDSLSDEISTATASTPFPKSQSISHIFPPNTSLLNSCGTGSRVESTASDVSFSLWIHSRPFAPLNPSSNSSTTSTFSPLRNPWSLSTSVPLSPCSVSPSTYPLLAKSSAHVFGQKNSFSPTPVLTTGGAPQSTLCLNCLKLSQPTPPGLCNVSSTPLAVSQNTPLFFGPLQPEMTPKVGAILPTTNASHPSTST
ncbi:uncharacterized protein LOC129872790 [Solanum dulcamara]|uniref:uncharacterized protein LOC129872790 n=1 Tax=Solanum dulcamara TaxID=45834 RepID=UPI0024851A4A|nr:uncharacterized protein LOC129872790 [Solanum dulcamara]